MFNSDLFDREFHLEYFKLDLKLPLNLFNVTIDENEPFFETIRRGEEFQGINTYFDVSNGIVSFYGDTNNVSSIIFLSSLASYFNQVNSLGPRQYLSITNRGRSVAFLNRDRYISDSIDDSLEGELGVVGRETLSKRFGEFGLVEKLDPDLGRIYVGLEELYENNPGNYDALFRYVSNKDISDFYGLSISRF